MYILDGGESFKDVVRDFYPLNLTHPFGLYSSYGTTIKHFFVGRGPPTYSSSSQVRRSWAIISTAASHMAVRASSPVSMLLIMDSGVARPPSTSHRVLWVSWKRGQSKNICSASSVTSHSGHMYVCMYVCYRFFDTRFFPHRCTDWNEIENLPLV